MTLVLASMDFRNMVVLLFIPNSRKVQDAFRKRHFVMLR